MAMYNYEKQIEEMIAKVREQNQDLDVEFNENYELDINGIKIQVAILEIIEPKEKDDEKTNMNKIEILFKTKDGYVKIAEVTNDNEIMIIPEGMEKAGLADKIELTGNDKISLEESEEEKEKNNKEQENDENKEEQQDEEKADEEEPELEQENNEEEKKEELARRYNVNSNQVVHISKDEKVTKDHRFDGLASFAKGYDDIYIIQGDDPYSWKTIGVKEGKEEEIDNESFKQMEGKNPDVTIKRIDGDEIKEIKPLAMYEIDSKTSVAIVKNNFGEPEALYCRQEGGDEKTYWGSVIPEASGKNVLQKDPKTRDFMSYKNNSSRDLIEKSDELEKAGDLEKRGIPSKQKGVQIEEIEGTRAQNRQYYKDEVKKDLYARLGIAEKMKNAMPGYLEYMDKKLDEKAEKIIRIMEEDEDITYEDAVKKVDRAENSRDEGGFTPDNPRKREH